MSLGDFLLIVAALLAAVVSAADTVRTRKKRATNEQRSDQ